MAQKQVNQRVRVTVDGEELFTDEIEPRYTARFDVDGSTVEVEVEGEQ